MPGIWEKKKKRNLMVCGGSETISKYSSAWWNNSNENTMSFEGYMLFSWKKNTKTPMW